jgi:hypothetical protein
LAFFTRCVCGGGAGPSARTFSSRGECLLRVFFFFQSRQPADVHRRVGVGSKRKRKKNIFLYVIYKSVSNRTDAWLHLVSFPQEFEFTLVYCCLFCKLVFSTPELFCYLVFPRNPWYSSWAFEINRFAIEAVLFLLVSRDVITKGNCVNDGMPRKRKENICIVHAVSLSLITLNSNVILCICIFTESGSMMALRRCRVAFLAALVLLASSSVRSQENELFHCPDGKSLMISVAILLWRVFFFVCLHVFITANGGYIYDRLES